MDHGSEDPLLQFFSEDYGGPAQPSSSISLFNLESQQETPTSPLSWDSVTPPSSPDAYLNQADCMDLDNAEALELFNARASAISSSLNTQSNSEVAQLFDNPTGLTTAQVQAIAAAMSSATSVVVKADPLQLECPPIGGKVSAAAFAEDLNACPLSEELSFCDEEDLEDMIDAAKAKRSRKKRKISPSESIDVLPEDIEELDGKSLLQLSSRAFEEYVRRKTSLRDLTSEEKKDVKRQRRLIKNRESAQASRLRKKNYIEKLEAKVASLQQSNSQLRTQVASLTTDKESLRQEVANLQGLIKKTPALQQLWTSGINYVASLAKQQSEETQQAPASTHGNNVKAAGVCLLVLLFSFGLFFPNLNGGSGSFPFEAVREPVPEVVPTTTRLFSSKGTLRLLLLAVANFCSSSHHLFAPSGVASDFTLASSGRTLLSENQFNGKRLEEARSSRTGRLVTLATVSAPKVDPTPAAVAAGVPRSANLSVLADVHSSDLMDVDTQGSRVEPVGHADHLNGTHVPSLAAAGASTAETAEQLRVDSEASVVASAAADVLNFKPNVTYLVCSNVQQITPPSDLKPDQSAPALISFLIPPDTFSARDPSSHRSGTNELLEVSCRVVGVNALPMLKRNPSALESPA